MMAHMDSNYVKRLRTDLLAYEVDHPEARKWLSDAWYLGYLHGVDAGADGYRDDPFRDAEVATR